MIVNYGLPSAVRENNGDFQRIRELENMRFFWRNRHSEDRIALQIAERYGLGEGYIRSRKQGMSPREALEDWDLEFEN